MALFRKWLEDINWLNLGANLGYNLSGAAKSAAIGAANTLGRAIMDKPSHIGTGDRYGDFYDNKTGYGVRIMRDSPIATRGEIKVKLPMEDKNDMRLHNDLDHYALTELQKNLKVSKFRVFNRIKYYYRGRIAYALYQWEI